MKKFLNINDIEICIDDTEHGENALLLIHGLTADKTSMYPIRDMFKENYRVITIDTRGMVNLHAPSNIALMTMHLIFMKSLKN